MPDLQAAGGAALTPPRPPVEPAHRRRLLVVLASVAGIGYALDVVTKVLAVEHLSGRPDVPLVGDWFTLHLTRNPGAAFSLGTSATFLLSLLAIAAVLAILWWSRRVGSAWWAVSLGLLLAGISGNLTDRLLRAPGPLHGHVIDFLRLPNWPVFNFADVFINAGGVLLVVTVMRGIEIDGSRAGDEPGTDAAAAEGRS